MDLKITTSFLLCFFVTLSPLIAQQNAGLTFPRDTGNTKLVVDKLEGKYHSNMVVIVDKSSNTRIDSIFSSTILKDVTAWWISEELDSIAMLTYDIIPGDEMYLNYRLFIKEDTGNYSSIKNGLNVQVAYARIGLPAPSKHPLINTGRPFYLKDPDIGPLEYFKQFSLLNFYEIQVPEKLNTGIDWDIYEKGDTRDVRYDIANRFSKSLILYGRKSE